MNRGSNPHNVFANLYGMAAEILEGAGGDKNRVFSPNMTFSEIGLDSLGLVELALAVETAYSVTVEDLDLKGEDTFDTLVTKIITLSPVNVLDIGTLKSDTGGKPLLNERIGCAAYAGYMKKTGGKKYDGTPMLSWAELRPDIQAAWVMAGEAAITAHYEMEAAERDKHDAETAIRPPRIL